MYHYKAEITRVIDGDTYECEIDLGFNVLTQQRVRLLGIDTPETRGETKEAGLRAKAFVQELLSVYGYQVQIRTHKEDSFGRWLSSVQLSDDTDLANRILEADHGVVYIHSEVFSEYHHATRDKNGKIIEPGYFTKKL